MRVVTGDYGQELTRRDRLAASAPLDELAAELEQAARCLDHFGGDADKAAVLAECPCGTCAPRAGSSSG